MLDFDIPEGPSHSDLLASFKPYDKVIIDSDDFKEGPVLGNVTQTNQDGDQITVEGIFAYEDCDGQPYLATFYVSADPMEGPDLVFTADVRVTAPGDTDQWDTTEPVSPVTIELR